MGCPAAMEHVECATGHDSLVHLRAHSVVYDLPPAVVRRLMGSEQLGEGGWRPCL